MNKCLIIGAGGFVGKHLVDVLKSDYLLITADTDINKTNYEDTINIEIDITDKLAIKNALIVHMPNVVINLAAQSSVSQSWSNPIMTFEINLMGTINLLESIKEINLECKILLVGSSEQYGDQTRFPIKETAQIKGTNFYAISKEIQEKVAKTYVKKYGLNIIMTRSFNHIGPYQDSRFVISNFCSQVVKIENESGKGELLVGNINVERDFADVRDVVLAYKMLLENGISGEIYNVGSGISRSIKEVLDIIIKNSDAEISIRISDDRIRSIDVMKSYADITKIQNTIGWKPSIEINKTILDLLNYQRIKYLESKKTK